MHTYINVAFKHTHTHTHAHSGAFGPCKVKLNKLHNPQNKLENANRTQTMSTQCAQEPHTHTRVHTHTYTNTIQYQYNTNTNSTGWSLLRPMDLQLLLLVALLLYRCCPQIFMPNNSTFANCIFGVH